MRPLQFPASCSMTHTVGWPLFSGHEKAIFVQEPISTYLRFHPNYCASTTMLSTGHNGDGGNLISRLKRRVEALHHLYQKINSKNKIVLEPHRVHVCKNVMIRDTDFRLMCRRLVTVRLLSADGKVFSIYTRQLANARYTRYSSSSGRLPHD